MTAVTSSGPTTAERIRSACVRAGSALLALEGVDPESTPVHHLLADGSFATLVPTGSVAAARVCSAGIGGVQAVLELTDYAPLPLREPVRSLVWIRGRLVPVPAGAVRATLDLIAAEHPAPVLLQVGTDFTLLRLEVESVVVADATTTDSTSSRSSVKSVPTCSSTGAGCSAAIRSNVARTAPAGTGTSRPRIQTRERTGSRSGRGA